ncbi:polygalacturonase [Caulobacter sp. D4A]|uniref:glycoside hydrolase family 28 protein n=1 Tax=unclassified Caulobacter TaxID=2648921 RepID=UPI000D72A11B|nr:MULTISPECIES: glycoside hydrolase family 28 protein [unclassified Caulobacter]PXA86252.1 polygalacturonase [Caulobacter sp. D4A]PXA92665.1 polygalacturonase [Caulobacter sp. D5]
MGIHLPTRRTALAAGLAAPLIPGQALAKPFPHKLVRPTAPFDMPSIGVPDFSGAKRFLITDFGADQGDQGKTSAAIAAAITAANAADAGVVVIPEGTWPTGKVHLKSNVALHLAKGATLLFSEKPADYLPAVQTTWEGLECWNYSPLVYAFDCENVAITGPGKLKAKLDVWKVWYARPKPHMDALVALYHKAARGEPVSERQMAAGEANLRPQFIQFNRCRHVLVEDVSIEDSPFWVIHPFLCTDVVIRRVKIRAHGHNNDGVDPEMSQNVLIEDCVFDQGDDAVSVKSGRDQDAWRLGVPTRNVVMRDCQIRNGHQLLAVGSELSAGIENVFVDNCHFTGDGRGEDGWAVPIANLMFVKTNERRGGFVRNIHMTNVSATKIAGSVLAVDTDVLYQWRTLVPTYERRLTAIEGLRVSDVRVEEAGSICRIKGEKDLPVRDVRLRKVAVGKVLEEPVKTENVEGFVSA